MTEDEYVARFAEQVQALLKEARNQGVQMIVMAAFPVDAETYSVVVERQRNMTVCAEIAAASLMAEFSGLAHVIAIAKASESARFAANNATAH